VVWLLLSVAIFAVIGFAYYWSTTAERRRVNKWKRGLSPREARRAELHAFDNEQEAELMTKAEREVATQRGARRLLRWGVGFWRS
jgi:hypothetical protein